MIDVLVLLLFIGLVTLGAVNFYRLYRRKEQGYPFTFMSSISNASAVAGLPIGLFMIVTLIADMLDYRSLLLTQLSILGLIIIMVVIFQVLKKRAGGK